MSPSLEISCPLCASPEHSSFHEDGRSYRQCAGCKLVFVLPENRLSPEIEKSRYDLHNNDPNDPRYRNFLNRLFKPICKKLKAGSHGLDFGSGPGPTLSIMLEEAGHHVTLFDSFYAPNVKAFEKQYDFITASEVIEHLHEPLKEMDRLWSCLKPGGWMGIMTTRLPSPETFHNWYYKNDDTHVCFYSLETFEWLAKHLNAKLEDASPEVILLQKLELEPKMTTQGSLG